MQVLSATGSIDHHSSLAGHTWNTEKSAKIEGRTGDVVQLAEGFRQHEPGPRR